VLTIVLVMYWTPQSDVWIFPGWQAWAALAYASFFATLLCYVFYTWSVTHSNQTGSGVVYSA
jgi:drug/metabolite transporter (DMT)-like permease